MAKLSIKADTRDAQKKVKELSNDVKRLHKEGSKPISPRVTRTGTATQAGKTSVAKTTGGVSGSSMALGGAVAGITGAMTTGAISAAMAAFDKLGLSILRMTTGISGLKSKIDKYSQAISVFEEPEKEALERGDKLDALDDQRRSHKSKDIAHEFGYSTTFRDVAGVNGNMVADKLQSWIDAALTGTFEDLQKNAKILSQFGLSFEQIAKNSTWENLAKIIKAYENAGKDGSNELEPIMQKIFGNRQIGTIRKLASQNWEEKAIKQEQEFRNKLPEEQVSIILKQTDKAEEIRRNKELEALRQPKPEFITAGAQIQLETEQLKTKAIAGDASGIATSGRKEFEKETGLTEYHGAIENALKKYMPAWMQGFYGLNSWFYDTKNNQIDNAKESWRKGDYIDSALKWMLPKTYQEGLQLDKWFYDTPTQTQNDSTNSNTMATEKLTNTFASGVQELSLQLKNNSQATQKMTTALSSMKTPQTTVTATNNTATFA